MKCPSCGAEVQSMITHDCNPLVKAMFEKPWEFEIAQKSDKIQNENEIKHKIEVLERGIKWCNDSGGGGCCDRCKISRQEISGLKRLAQSSDKIPGVKDV